MMHLLGQFILALFATAGFAIIFRVPVRHIPSCVVIGALGWVCYEILMYSYSSPVIGCFFASCVVGLLSYFAARIFKEATTVFVIPGILCLVPGSKIFSTMYELLDEDISAAAQVGTETILMAGAIAVGLLTVGAFLRVVRSLVRRTITVSEILIETGLGHLKNETDSEESESEDSEE